MPLRAFPCGPVAVAALDAPGGDACLVGVASAPLAAFVVGLRDAGAEGRVDGGADGCPEFWVGAECGVFGEVGDHGFSPSGVVLSSANQRVAHSTQSCQE